MKRRFLFIPGLLILVLLAATVLWSQRNTDAPRFVPGAPPSLPPFTFDYYGWLGDVPFQNDRLWLWTDTRPHSHAHVYLYDLRRRAVLGELFNGWTPELCSRDGSRILVIGSDLPERTFMESLVEPLFKLFGKKSPPPSRRAETLWILDISRNSAKRIGVLHQYAGADTSWSPSPDFRHGFNMPSTSMGTALFLCDLEQPSLTRISIAGYPVGWWDEHNILVETGTNQFDLLDIGTRTTRNLFNPTDFQNVLARHAITNDSAEVYSFVNWSGSNYDFYFGIRDQFTGLQGSNSFLLKAAASAPQLALLYPQFQFRWSGRLDTSGKLYLFPGESGQPGRSGDGSVYLRDLTHSTVSTLVPPKIKGQYTSPRFYGNEVIYFRDSLIHRVGLDGSNDTPILMPPAK